MLQFASRASLKMTFGIGTRAVLHPLDPLTFDRHRGGHFSLRTIVQRRGRWNTTRPVNNGNRFMKRLAGSAYTTGAGK